MAMFAEILTTCQDRLTALEASVDSEAALVVSAVSVVLALPRTAHLPHINLCS
jgi:hypothetical protein